MKNGNELDSIKIIDNILTDQERIIFLNNLEPLLKRIQNCPGLQTHAKLHESPVFSNLIAKIVRKCNINRKIVKSWVNYTDKDIAYESWHSHPRSFHTTICYMIENPEGIGTLFKIGDEIFPTECPTNSVMLFSSDLLHTVPPNVTMPRYSLAIDFKYKKMNIQYQ